MTANEVQQLEQNIKQAQKIADLGAAMDRLANNRDFKKVISEGYFEQEAIRLVHLKADPNMQTPEYQKSIVAQMDAIGSLNQYFITLGMRAGMAGKSIEADEQVLSELLVEGLQ